MKNVNEDILKQRPSRYVEGISSDMFLTSPDFGSNHAALAIDNLSFCKECGAVVYRRDLHDAFHSQAAASIENSLRKALGK